MEKRSLVIPGAELRATPEFCIVAKALSYNKPSPDDQLGKGAREMILPGCFADSISAGDDVRALVNHNPDRLLGRRSNGTLSLMDSPDGLRFKVQLDKTRQDHADVYAAVQRGDLNECSFSFTDTQDSWIDDIDSKGQPCKTRVLRKAKLFDVSLVCWPFYSDPGSTSAEARSHTRRGTYIEAHDKPRIATLRKATRLMSGLLKRDGDSGAGDEMALVREHLRIAHEFLEAACSTCDTARGLITAHADKHKRGVRCTDPDCDLFDDDDYEDAFRGFANASEAVQDSLNQCCDDMAACRMAQPTRKKKK